MPWAAPVNLIGDCLATVVVARSEGEFDDHRAKVFGTPAEVEIHSSLATSRSQQRCAKIKTGLTIRLDAAHFSSIM